MQHLSQGPKVVEGRCDCGVSYQAERTAHVWQTVTAVDVLATFEWPTVVMGRSDCGARFRLGETALCGKQAGNLRAHVLATYKYFRRTW